MHRAQKGRLENVPEKTDTEFNTLFLDEQRHIPYAYKIILTVYVMIC